MAKSRNGEPPAHGTFWSGLCGDILFSILFSHYVGRAARITGRCTDLPLSSHLCLNFDPAINCHPSVSQARWFINGCAIPEMDVKLGISFASTTWWTLKIPTVSFRWPWLIMRRTLRSRKLTRSAEPFSQMSESEWLVTLLIRTRIA